MRIKITTADGRTWVGTVHGSGGIMRYADTVDRLRRAQCQARKGQATGLYEPLPGCVMLYGETVDTAGGVSVPLSGAEFEVAS